MAREIPNLDAMERLEIFKFWSDNFNRNSSRAAEFFPDKPRGYVRALKDLCNYASNKSAAMLCRERGDIAAALVYEHICDRIYRDLPNYAKSW